MAEPRRCRDPYGTGCDDDAILEMAIPRADPDLHRPLLALCRSCADRAYDAVTRSARGRAER
jgi:hypothetical protein